MKGDVLELEDLLNLYDSSMDFHRKRFKRIEENIRLRSHDHLSETEKAAYESQGRQNITIPLIASKINYFVGHQRAYRSEWKVTPKQDPADEIKASIYSLQLADLEERCNMKYVESEVFDSGIGTDCGCYEIYLGEDKSGNKIPCVRSIDPRDFIYDKNATDYDRSDGVFMAKMKKDYRYNLRVDYPDAKVDRLSESYYTNYFNLGKDDFYYYFNSNNPDYDVLTVFTHYNKVVRTFYHVYFNDFANLNGNIDKVYLGRFKNKKDAEGYLRQQHIPYLDNGLASEMDKGRVVKKTVVCIDKYVFTVDSLLEHEETELSNFPFVPYYSFSHLDNYWTLTDMLKTAQQEFDRLMAQIDYGLARDIKQGYEVVVPKLHNSITPVEAMNMLQENGVIPVNEAGAVTPIATQGINWQWVNVASTMQGFIEEMAAGRSFQGLSSGANETGVAVEAKARQGSLYGSVFLDNLQRSKIILAVRLIEWFSKYDKTGRIIKIAGESLPPEFIQGFTDIGLLKQSLIDGNMGYFKLDAGLRHLENADFEIQVSTRKLTDSEQDKKLNQLIAVTQVNPMVGQTMTYMREMLKAIDLDFKTRADLIKELESLMYNQMVQQQAAQQYAMNNQLQSAVLQQMEAKNKQKENKKVKK